MADPITVPGAAQEAQTPVQLVCRLRRKEIVGARGPLMGWGELELENLSRDVVEIRYDMSPLQYLELVVTGPSGDVVSQGYFGNRFSPFGEERVLRLRPGETFTGEVPLLGTVPREKRPPGTYQVQAVYEYNGVRAASEPLPVTI
jgi:hypothetical protein